MFNSKTARNIFILSMILALLCVGGMFYMYQYISFLKNPEEVARKEIKDTVMRVGKIFDLPKDEDPILANIGSVDDINKQPFFKNANVGDQILIYEKNKKIILYSPIKNKIIEVTYLNMKEGDSISL